MSTMHRSVIVLVVWVSLVEVAVSASDCSPAVEGCRCSGSLIQCQELSTLPDLPDGIQQVFCNDCYLGPAFDKLKIPVSYKDITNLLLSNCEIESIANETFEDLQSLEILDLKNNKLSALSKATFKGLTSLNSLVLDGNELKNLPSDVFKNLIALNRIDMSHNAISDLDANILDGLAVTWLKLASVGFTDVPVDLLKNVGTSLQHLDLNHNTFKTLKKNSFNELLELDFLSMDSCQIEKFEGGALNGLDKLTHLNIGYNQLSTLESSTFKPLHDTLKEFYFEHNKLQTLDMEVVAWDNIRSIELGGNPWHCDCDIKWMKTLDIEHLEHPLQENVTCATPESFRGHNLQNVTEEMLCDCVGCGSNSTVALAVAIPILIICIALIGYYMYRIMQNRRNQAMKRRGYNYSSVYKDTTEPSLRTAGPV